MTELLRIGFIGCGDFATSTLWPCLRYAPVEVAYACARHLDRAERNRRRFGAEQATTDVAEVLGDTSVAAVFVVGPPAMQYEITLRALSAGKHVFVEKPPADTVDQAIELERVAGRAGVQCQVAFQKRFALTYRMARDAMVEDSFGEVSLIKINYAHWSQPDWHTHLTIMGVHPIDLARFFLGDPDEAHVLKRTSRTGCNTCLLTMLYDSGTTAVVNLSANEPHVQEWVELAGANQLIKVGNLVDYRRWKPAGDWETSFTLDPTAISGWHPEFAIPYQQADSMWLQGYAGEVVGFADTILAGRPVSPSIADGVAALRYTDAILAAPEGMSRLTLTDSISTKGVPSR